MLNIKRVWSKLGILAMAVLFAACGGGGGSDGGSGSAAVHEDQNVIYVGTARNTVAAARDDASIPPFNIVTFNGGTVIRVYNSPDSSHVAALVYSASTNVYNLYVSESNGAYTTRVTNLPPGRSLFNITWAPDGKSLAFLADYYTVAKYELFRTGALFEPGIPPDSSASTFRISGTIDSSSTLDIASPQWSPDGSKIAYLVTDSARTTARHVVGLNIYNVNGGARNSLRLTPSFQGYQDIRGYSWSPNGKYLAYSSNPLSDGVYQVYQIEFLQNTIVLSRLSSQTGYSHYNGLSYSSDSKMVAAIEYNSTLGVRNIHIWSSATGNVVHAINPKTGDIFDSFEWAPQLPLMAYRTYNKTLNDTSLFLADPATNNLAILINSGSTTGDQTSLYYWSHDSDRIATIFKNTNGYGLKVYNRIGGQWTTVAGPVASPRVIFQARWSQDDLRLAYMTYESGCSNAEIHSTSPTALDVINLGSIYCQGLFVY